MNRITLAAFGAAFVVIVGLGVYIDHLKGANRALAMRAYNDSAALDTSRSVALSRKDSIKILGDSIQAVTKLASQRTIERDRLDKALNEQQAANVALTVTIGQLRASQVVSVKPVTVDTTTGDRSAQFHVEQAEWTADAAVKLPAAGAGHLDLDVFVRPTRLGLRIGCQPANSDGVRPARVTATSGTGVAVKIDSATTDPDVCQPQAQQRTRWYQAFKPSVVAGVGLSFSADSANTVQVRKSLFLGISLWHWPK